MNQLRLQKREISLLIVIGILIMGISLLMMNKGKEEKTFSEEMFEVTETETEPTQEEQTAQIIVVDVKGEVTNPGVYELSSGSRVLNAIELAGGFTTLADQTQINLAQKLGDEMAIYVPKRGEKIESFQSEGGNGKLNINHANVEEFQKLSGIGPAKAQAIIDYRTEHGDFKKIEGLLDVSGIGEGTFNKIKEEVGVY